MIKLPDFSACVEVKHLLQKMGVIKIPELPDVEFVKTRVKIVETIVPNTEQLQFAE